MLVYIQTVRWDVIFYTFSAQLLTRFKFYLLGYIALSVRVQDVGIIRYR